MRAVLQELDIILGISLNTQKKLKLLRRPLKKFILSLHLFAQLEKLSDDDLKGEELKEEILRTKAIEIITKQIIDNGHLALQAQKLKNNIIDADMEIPKMLEG